MPFGAVYGGLLFLLAAILFALPFWTLLHPDFRLTEVLLGVLSATVALGLWSGRRWARGLGIALALGLAGLLGAVSATAAGLLVAFAALVGVVLLAVPATGRFAPAVAPAEAPLTAPHEGGDPVREDADAAPAPPAPRRRVGALGALAVLSILAASVSFAVTWATREPPDAAGADLAALGLRGVEWHDFGPGVDRAALESKPVLVDFFAEWCNPCKAMDRNTFRDPAVVAALAEVVAVRIDAESTVAVHGYVGEELAERYGVVSYPTLVLMDVEGHEIARARGYKNPRQFLAWLDAALGNAPDGGPAGAPGT